ncbi:hypothetical protein H0H93_009105 [Arthromyces matolae]|nr:hypothetical protein H0H93_009105 [Arthromyces matolae]
MPQGLSSLSRLAVTCISLKEAALNSLWRNQTSLVPLIMVMPADLWTITDFYDDFKNEHIIEFTRLLDEDDWTRFDHYCSRVINLMPELKEPFHGRIHIPLSIFFAFSAYRPLRALLPKLQVFHLSTELARVPSFIPLLLGPSVTKFYIRGLIPGVAKELPGLVSAVCRLCPNLEIFDRWDSAIEKLVSSSPYLKEIALAHAPLTSKALHYLGILPKLHRVQFGIAVPSGVSEPQSHISLISANDGFPHLRTLEVYTRNLDIAKLAIEPLTQPLTTLHVNALKNGKANLFTTIHAFTETFARLPLMSSLTSLRLEFFASYALDGELSNSFEVFFAAPNLSSFKIVSECVCALDDTWLAAAAKAWPNLETFLLRSFPPEPKPTLLGLLPLVQHCPKLKSLSLSIAAKPIKFQSDRIKFCNCAVTSLNLCTSSIENPTGVFRSLVGIFPNLRSIKMRALHTHEGWRKTQFVIGDSHTWVKSDEDDAGATIEFSRSLEHDDWTRFDYYSSRITCLGSNREKISCDDLEVDESIFIALGTYRPFHALLPSLRVVHFTDTVFAPVRFVPLLLSPSITKLVIPTAPQYSIGDLPGLLSAVSRLCPNLEIFELSNVSSINTYIPSGQRWNSALENLLSSSSALKEVRLGQAILTSKAISHLATLPKLYKVQIAIETSHISDPQFQTTFTSASGRFRGLRVVHINVRSLDNAWRALESLHHPLESLFIQSGLLRGATLNRLPTLIAFAETFQRHPFVSSLAILKLEFASSTELDEGEVRKVFQVFFAARNLKTFMASSACLHSIDDTWLAAAAKAWPQLKTLYIVCTPTTPKPTLSGLLPLIQHCPKLRSVGLSIDTRVPTSNPARIYGNGVTSLMMFNSIIEHPVRVFRDLIVMLPNLQSVKVHPDPSDKDWKRVNSLLEESRLGMA